MPERRPLSADADAALLFGHAAIIYFHFYALRRMAAGKSQKPRQ